MAELRAYERDDPQSISKPMKYQLISQSMKDFRFANDDVEDYNKLLEKASVSYDNLIRLNLIETKVDLGEVPAYENFEKSSYMKEFTRDTCDSINDNTDSPFQLEYHYTWHIVKLTKYGISFCDIAMPSSNQSEQTP